MKNRGKKLLEVVKTTGMLFLIYVVGVPTAPIWLAWGLFVSWRESVEDILKRP